MDFGIFMEFEIRAANQAGAFEEGFHLVDAAEAWGLDIAWLSEMHFSPSCGSGSWGGQRLRMADYVRGLAATRAAPAAAAC